MKKYKIQTTKTILFTQTILLIILKTFFKFIFSIFFQNKKKLNHHTTHTIPQKTKQKIQNLYIPIKKTKNLTIN